MSKKRTLKDILNDMNITAMRIGEYKYVNSAMISEALEYITEINKYYETQGDMIDDIQEIIEELERDE